MAKIYKQSDRIKVAVDDLIVTIAPLSLDHKALIEEAASKGTAIGLISAAKYAVKYGVKSIQGLEDADGNSYKLNIDEPNGVDDSCLDDLFNIEASGKLSSMCLNLINGIPGIFYDPITGSKLDGVEFVASEKSKPSKKSKAASGK